MPDAPALPFRKLLQYAAAWAFLALYVWQLWLIVSNVEFKLWYLLLIPVALYLADAASGIAHFVIDYTPTPTGLGLKELFYYEGSKGSVEYTIQRQQVMKKINALQEVVFDFKIHHISPLTLARRHFLQLALPIIFFASLPLSLIFLTLFFAGILGSGVFLFLWTFIGALTLSQYAHSCAHKPKPAGLISLLQRSGLFLTAAKHNSHHSDLGQDFCMLNGWANAPVNWLFNRCRRRGMFDSEHLTPA